MVLKISVSINMKKEGNPLLHTPQLNYNIKKAAAGVH